MVTLMLATSGRDEADETLYPDRHPSILIPLTLIPLSSIYRANIQQSLRYSSPYRKLADKIREDSLVIDATFLSRALSDDAQDFLSDANPQYCSNMQTFDSRIGP